MTIGIPKEIKTFENRVGLIPFYVNRLVKEGHKVFIQKGAGLKTGYGDILYSDAGAEIVPTIEDVYNKSELIIKVKEPQQREFSLINEGQTIFSFFHFPSSEVLLDSLIQTKCIAITYETLETENKKLPILTPMSAIAGKLAIHQGMIHLENITGGKGVLLGGVPGVSTGNVVIIGAGVVGRNACYVAGNLRANVTLLDINMDSLRELHDVMPNNVQLLFSNEENLYNALRTADLVVTAVHLIGRKPPVLITNDMLSIMEENTVIVDVSIDQGGCLETSRPTTHLEPTFKENGIIHYCVPNMPSLVPKTATQVLSHASYPYIIKLANQGIHKAIQNDDALKSGLNLWKGQITNKNISETFRKSFIPFESLMNN